MVQEGTRAPSFRLKDSSGRERRLDEFSGKWAVLYFYPRDDTSGCTLEALEFSALEEDFKNLGAVVVGISPDTCESHARFIGKHNLTVLLLSDPEKKVLELYGAWRIKKMYGKESMGVARSTVLVSPRGEVAKTWKSVRAAGHAARVLEVIREMARA
jgi:peroxiredoxin Q/BCP